MQPILTDIEYFSKEPLYIEQALENNGMPTDLFEATIAAFSNAWVDYERKYLRLLLGKDLRDEFYVKSELPVWEDLKALLWQTEEASNPNSPRVFTESPVADYIYFWYTSDHSAVYNGQVLRQAKVDSATTIQVVQKQVWVWGRMKENTLIAMAWLDANYSKMGAAAALDKTEWPKLLSNYNSFGI